MYEFSAIMQGRAQNEKMPDSQKNQKIRENSLLYDREKAKGVIGEQIGKIKKNPLASQDQQDCATMEVSYKNSLAVHLRHELKNDEMELTFF